VSRSAASASSQPGLWPRLGRFLKKPWLGQVRAAGLYARNVFPAMPIPIRLPNGYWWLAWNNHLGDHLLAGGFEEPEYAFVQRFLKEGMVVLDVGANEGYYTVLASKCVGPGGRVIGFEPSPRERRRLRMNLWMNQCANVRVEGLAMGSEEGQVNLHVVQGAETGCNSLRPPDIQGRTRPVQVAVTTLDQFLRRNAIPRIDFIKMDIEGAELSALQGAAGLLRTLPRPVLLIEVFEIRSRPWGYSSRDIVKILTDAGYLPYRPVGNGDLETVDPGRDCFDANLIVVPKERISEIAGFLSVPETHSCLPSK
jgi:FkbM family methyltransferase